MKKSGQVEHPSTERVLCVQNCLRKCNTSVCFKQSLMAMLAQPSLGGPDRPCVHRQIQHSQPCTTAHMQACREMLTRLRVQIHSDIVFAGYGHV